MYRFLHMCKEGKKKKKEIARSVLPMGETHLCFVCKRIKTPDKTPPESSETLRSIVQGKMLEEKEARSQISHFTW